MFKSPLLTIAFLFFTSIAFCQADTTVAANYFQKGYELEIAKKYKEALAEYDSCVTANPNYSKVYLYRGLVKYYLLDFKGSVDDYTKYIAANPESAMAFDNRGYSKFLLDDNEGAMADYNKSIILNPNVMRPYLNRGGLKSNSGNLKKPSPISI